MKGVTVKSLFNDTWEVATTEQGTVGDVLEQLATADTRLAAAALLFRGRKLKRTVQVGDIISSSDDFLTLVMKRPKSSIQVNGSRQPWQRARNLSDELENKHVRHRPEEARSEGPAGGADTPHEGAAHEPANPSRLGRRSGAQMVDHNGCASMPQEQQLPSGHYQQAGQEEYSNDKAGAGRPITPLEHATRASNAGRAACSPSNTHAPSGNVSTNDGAAAAPHAAEPGEVDRMFEELQGELNAVRSIPVQMSALGGTAEREAVPDARLSEAGKAAKGTPPAADSAAPKRNRRKSMKPRPSAKTGAQASAASQHSQNLLALPLPPPLQRLEDIFGVLNTVYGFLLTQNIQATWHNMREATQQLLQQSEEPINPCVADIIAMNRLAPTVVVIRHQAIPVDGGAECDGSNEDGVFMIELRDGSGGARQDGIAQVPVLTCGPRSPCMHSPKGYHM